MAKSKWSDEYPEDPKILAWIFYPMLIVFTILAGIFIQWQEESALTYTLLSLFCVMMIGLYRANPKGFVGVQAFGQPKNMLLAGVAGIGFAVISPILGLSVGVPLSVITVASLRIIYQVIGASFIEETAFRYILFPTFKRWLGDAHASAILQAIAFAGWHLVFFQLSILSVGIAFVIGYLLAIGNQTAKSGIFSLVYHLINNYRKLMVVG